MAKAKLTKTQQAELERIQSQYATKLENQKAECIKSLEEATEFFFKDYTKHRLAELEEGFILYRAYYGNQKTLEKLAELGYIEYRACGRRNICTTDTLKLL